jgi:hypothetical protein
MISSFVQSLVGKPAKKVGILCVCTGKYQIFWKEFFISSECFLLPECQKTYYVFTDAPHLPYEECTHVRKIGQANWGWPGNTLLRYDMFLRAEQALLENDYLFFFNVNVAFSDYIYAREILPELEGLTAVIHPNFFGRDNRSFVYERNPASTAYIPYGQGAYYYMGGINGGTTQEYLQMVRTLACNIRTDLSNGIIASVYDESHLNNYLLNKQVKVLEPSYGYPEGWNYPLPCKILIKDKAKWGGHGYLRGI